MKITADTNVLIRAIIGDDVAQARIAAKTLREAESIAITLPSLCEFVWVLQKVYSVQSVDIASAMNALLSASNVQVDRNAVAAGLAVLKAGGDFADGIIAYEGNWLGGETFVSFDKKAVSLLKAQGHSTRLLVTSRI